MKKALIVILLSFFFKTNLAQNKIDNKRGKRGISNDLNTIKKPLYLLNGILINPDTIENENSFIESISTVIGEGDSAWVAWYYKGLDSSVIFEYFGEARNNSIMFFFTKDKVKQISIDSFKKLVNTNEKFLFKNNSKPISRGDSLTQIENIIDVKMIKDFPLKKWNTGEVDTFKLFIVKSK